MSKRMYNINIKGEKRKKLPSRANKQSDVIARRHDVNLRTPGSRSYAGRAAVQRGRKMADNKDEEDMKPSSNSDSVPSAQDNEQPETMEENAVIVIEADVKGSEETEPSEITKEAPTPTSDGGEASSGASAGAESNGRASNAASPTGDERFQRRANGSRSSNRRGCFLRRTRYGNVPPSYRSSGHAGTHSH